jgi:hypothetical protein
MVLKSSPRKTAVSTRQRTFTTGRPSAAPNGSAAAAEATDTTTSIASLRGRAIAPPLAVTGKRKRPKQRTPEREGDSGETEVAAAATRVTEKGEAGAGEKTGRLRLSLVLF